MRKGLIILILMYLCVVSAKGQDRSYSTLKVDASSIKIDGSIDEAVWEKVNWAGEFTQFEPSEGKKPTQNAEFKIIYDDDYIYIALKAYDTETDKIVKRLARRDQIDGDMLFVQFDSYYDKKTAFTFGVSAAGVRYDAVNSNDGEDEDETWDPIWIAKSNISDFGWSAEMKIPLSQLRFGKKENQVWGLQVGRFLFRNNELDLWQPMSKEKSGWVSRFGILTGLKNLKPKRQLEIAPFFSSKLNLYEAEEGNPFADGKDMNFNAGIDGKIGLTNDLTLDFAVNPDFGQVEADPSEVNLTAFETFFDEKRPFFVEGSNITDYQITPGGSPWSDDNLFYSRRIGGAPLYDIEDNISEDEYAKSPGNTRILGAVKLTGKTKKGISIGIIESFTNKEYAKIDLNGTRRREVVEPYTNYFAGRLQKDMNEGNTIIGGMITSTNRFTDNDNFDFLNRSAITGGLDFKQYFSDKKYFINATLVGSYISGKEQAMIELQESPRRYFQRPDADYMTFDSTRTSLSGYGGNIIIGKQSNKGFSGGIDFTWRSPGLELNDMGYLRTANTVFHFLWANYRITDPVWIFRIINFEANEWAGWDFGGTNNFVGFNFSSWIQFKNLWSFGFNISRQNSGIDNSMLRGGPAIKTPGNLSYNFHLSTSDTKKIILSGGMFQNSADDNYADNIGFFGEISYRPFNFISISVNPEYFISREELQYVDNFSYNDEELYFFGEIEQHTFYITTRIDITLTPDFTIQYYGSPFISAAKYSNFKKITNPMASDYDDRFHVFTGNEIMYLKDDESYGISESGTGIYDYYLGLPDFNYQQFRSNLVLRWEYKPGSLLYLVWSQDKTDDYSDGAFNLADNLKNMFKIKSNDIFLIKLSYRFIL